MITISRYNAIRERLIFLYNIVNNRHYRVWVAPKTLMSIDELRQRSHVTFEGSLGDPNYYNEPQLRKFSIPGLIDILPNATSIKEFGFNDANNTVVEMYDSIQEYIGLWCEIISNTNEFKTPPKEELRKLETWAWFIYPLYRRVKPFKVNNDIRKQIDSDIELNKKGLAGLGMLFSVKNKAEDLSFVSHLDNLDGPKGFSIPDGGGWTGVELPTPPPIIRGGLAAIEEVAMDNDEWLFRG